MQRTQRKNARRTVRDTFGRFCAIFGIVMLGVGFLDGLVSTEPSMRYSCDRYFDECALYDVRVRGTLGVTEEDIAALYAVPGTEGVMAGYCTDAIILSADAQTTLCARVHSLPDARGAALNNPVLTEGRMPVRAGECVLNRSTTFLETDMRIGDNLRVLEDQTDTLSCEALIVVGFAHSPAYFSLESESSSAGKGTVDLVLYTPPASFSSEVYTDVYLTGAGLAGLDSLTDAYEDEADAFAARVESIAEARCAARYETIYREADETIAEAQAAYDDAKASADKEFADAEAKLADAEAQIEENEASLAAGRAEIEKNRKALADGRRALDREQAAAEAQFAEGQHTIDALTTDLNEQRAALSAAQKNTAAALSALGLAEDDPDFLALRTALMNGTSPDAALAALGARLGISDPSSPVLTELLALAAGANVQSGLAAQIDAAAAQLAARQAMLDSARESAAAGFAAAQKELDSGSAALLRAQKKVQDGEAALADAEKELALQRETYEAQRADALAELSEALAEIESARADLANLEMPRWIVETRAANTSVASFRINAQKIAAIAEIFPIFFFLVAALVSLTTMTRMVDEERLFIGTMKALGYRNSSIMAKYLFYAFSATVLGCTAGIAVGFWFFPSVIWNAYTMMFALPYLYCPVQWDTAISASAFALVCTMGGTLCACVSSLREKPARLMQKKAPKPGKRILLERVSFLWSRLKFTQKVTARNLFRYRKRFYMTIIGVAGCTALLVTGFGVHDSISDIVHTQFGELNTYEATAVLADEKSPEDPALAAVLNDRALVTDFLPVRQEKSSFMLDRREVALYLFVPQDNARLNDFLVMRHRLSGETFRFEGGAVVSEKMAEMLGLSIGSSLTVKNRDGVTGTVTVAEICENYVENYLYLSEKCYEDAFGESAPMNMLLLQTPGDSAEQVDALGERLLASGQVLGFRSISGIKDSFDNAMQKIDIIVVVLIISAAALAFIVLYNLTNININERAGEIATIKVLGFTRLEVGVYVYRENVLLTLIGAALGLVLGVFLHRFVVLSVEIDVVMFGRFISVQSYFHAFILTLVFGFLVNLVMYRKLDRISMVDSLKAPE